MDQGKIGKFIAKCRKEKNMTQQDLAFKLGITDRAISNWENGKNMPDLSLFKPLCVMLDITINDLLSGEKVKKDEYRERLEENIVNTIDYTSRKMEKQKNFLALIFTALGILISFTATSIFPSESSWGGIYSIFGVFISLIGVNVLIGKVSISKKVLLSICYTLISFAILFVVDYIGVVNIKQAPRYSIVKVSGENVIYYDTPFYDVVRCNVNKDNERFKVLKNQKYDIDSVDEYCN